MFVKGATPKVVYFRFRAHQAGFNCARKHALVIAPARSGGHDNSIHHSRNRSLAVAVWAPSKLPNTPGAERIILPSLHPRNYREHCRGCLSVQNTTSGHLLSKNVGLASANMHGLLNSVSKDNTKTPSFERVANASPVQVHRYPVSE